jgi:hypothetical protein
MDDHTDAPYKDDELLTMEQIALLWGVKKKTIQAYRFASTRDHPERFPPPDVQASYMPLWYYRTIRDFKRPMQVQREEQARRTGSVTA